MTDWKAQIETWNANMRAGLGEAVASEMAKIPISQIPREQMAGFANLAWRINRPLLGLRATFPEIKRQHALKLPVRPDILTEHSACLLEIGAIEEAKRTLVGLGNLSARASFVLALLHFKEWDYESACPLLESCLEKIPAGYHQLVVKVNLASAYVVVGKWERAHQLLDSLTQELEQKGHTLLLGNSYEIKSQIYFFNGEYAEALKQLDKSELLLKKTKNMGWLYCKKWQLINRAFVFHKKRAGLSAELISEMKWIYLKSQDMKSWESMRDLDLFTGLLMNERRLVNRVYFGSPSRFYKKRVRNLASHYSPEVRIDDHFVFGSDKDDGEQTKTAILTKLMLDVENGRLQSFLPRKLLLTLASDAYAPVRTGQIFSALFGSDHFDPGSSPDKVFQLVKRVRSWLIENSPGLQVKSSKTGYVLEVAKGHGLLVDRELIETEIADRSDLYLIGLKQEFGKREFSSGELGRVFNMSTRSSNRVLKNLEASSAVVRTRHGPQTRYRIAG